MTEEKYPKNKFSDFSEEELDQLLTEIDQPFTEAHQERVIENIQQKKNKKIHLFPFRSRRTKIAAAAVLLLAIAPSTAWAANKLWDVFTAKNDARTTITIKNNGKVQNKYYQLDYAYVPQGFVTNESDPLYRGLNYWLPARDKVTFNASLRRVKDKQTVIEQLYTANKNEETINGHQVVWLTVKANEAAQYENKFAYIFFEKEQIMAELSFNHISPSDSLKIVRGLSLKEVSQEKSNEILDLKSDDIEKVTIRKGESAASTEVFRTDGSESTMQYDTSYTVNVRGAGNEKEAKDDEAIPLTVSVSAPQFSQKITPQTGANTNISPYSLDGLKKHHILQKDGTLTSYKAGIYQRGDGKTLDKKLKDVTVTPQYVSLTFTVKNQSSKDYLDMHFAPYIALLEKTSKGYCYPSEAVYAEPVRAHADPAYMSIHGASAADYQNIGTLKAGETKEITVGYVLINPMDQEAFIQLSLGDWENSTKAASWIKITK